MDPEGAVICGQTLQVVGEFAKWPGAVPRIPWHVDTSGYGGGMTAARLHEAFALAWQQWADVVEIDPVPSATAAEAWVRSHFARIDGPSNVLAWSELADNTNRPKTQRYDSGDNWTFEWESSGIPLVVVAIHEIGHVIGLDHDGSSANAIMRPTVSRSISRPTERDFQRLVGLGYTRRTAPPPPPMPPPVPPVPTPSTGLIVIDFEGGLIKAPSRFKLV